MMRRWPLLLLSLLALVPRANAEPNRGPFSRIAVIVLRDDSDEHIDPSVKTSVLRRIAEAREFGADCVIFDIESYGGLVSASLETGQEMLDLGNDVHTIAYIHRKAISGAAMLSLACREIVMNEAASIGDSQVIFMGADGREVAPEKAQTVVAAEFRKYAQRNGYPEALCEAMVRQEIEVWRYRKLQEDGTESFVYYRSDRLPDRATREMEALTDAEVVVPEGELLTLTAKEAVKSGIASRLEPTVDTLIESIRSPETKVARFYWNEAEELSRWLMGLRPLLFLLGIVAAYIAFKTPGTGIPEVIALVLFGLYFGAAAIAGFAETWEVILFFAGVALILVEIFVLPGFGIAGFLGLFLLLASLALSSIPPIEGGRDVYPGQNFLLDIARDFVLAALGATVVMFFLARYLPHTPFFRRLSLAVPGRGSALEAVAPNAQAHPLVGARGRAESALRPSGRARIDGEDRDVVSEAGYVEKGGAIRVVAVRGSAVIVRPEQDPA